MQLLNRKVCIIAIDGPAGSGKSTVAKLVAGKLKIPYIDTGAMYRCVTLQAMRSGLGFSDSKRLARVAKSVDISFKNAKTGSKLGRAGATQKVFLSGEDVTHAIRDTELTKNVFYVAQEPGVRLELVKRQRVMGKTSGAVMEGRDIGTVVFPDADYKFFVSAKPEVRARRRYEELIEVGKSVRFADVLKELKSRDRSDSSRKQGPLKKAKDAIFLDTTELTIHQVVDRILKHVRSQG